MVTEYPFLPIATFFEGIVPGILGRVISFQMTRGNMALVILLGNIPRSYLVVSALVCIPLIMKPLIQVFEIVGSLVRAL